MLVIPIRFPEDKSKTLPTMFQLQRQYNSEENPKSFKEVMRQATYGKLVVESHISNWLDMQRNPRGVDECLLREALDIWMRDAEGSQFDGNADVISEMFDSNEDGIFDMVHIIHSGQDGLGCAAAEKAGTLPTTKFGMWKSKKKTCTEDMILSGLYSLKPAKKAANLYFDAVSLASAHEFKTSGIGYQHYPVGFILDTVGWTIGMPRNTVNMYKRDIVPVYPGIMTAWGKFATRTLQPPHVIIDPEDENSGIGYVTLKPTNSFECGDIMAIYLTTGDPKEFFVIEYREAIGKDADLSKQGMMLWHVNENTNDGRFALIPHTTDTNPPSFIWVKDTCICSGIMSAHVVSTVPQMTTDNSKQESTGLTIFYLDKGKFAIHYDDSMYCVEPPKPVMIMPDALPDISGDTLHCTNREVDPLDPVPNEYVPEKKFNLERISSPVKDDRQYQCCKCQMTNRAGGGSRECYLPVLVARNVNTCPWACEHFAIKGYSMRYEQDETEGDMYHENRADVCPRVVYNGAKDYGLKIYGRRPLRCECFRRYEKFQYLKHQSDGLGLHKKLTEKMGMLHEYIENTADQDQFYEHAIGNMCLSFFSSDYSFEKPEKMLYKQLTPKNPIIFVIFGLPMNIETLWGCLTATKLDEQYGGLEIIVTKKERSTPGIVPPTKPVVPVDTITDPKDPVYESRLMDKLGFISYDEIKYLPYPNHYVNIDMYPDGFLPPDADASASLPSEAKDVLLRSRLDPLPFMPPYEQEDIPIIGPEFFKVETDPPVEVIPELIPAPILPVIVPEDIPPPKKKMEKSKHLEQIGPIKLTGIHKGWRQNGPGSDCYVGPKHHGGRDYCCINSIPKFRCKVFVKPTPPKTSIADPIPIIPLPPPPLPPPPLPPISVLDYYPDHYCSSSLCDVWFFQPNYDTRDIICYPSLEFAIQRELDNFKYIFRQLYKLQVNTQNGFYTKELVGKTNDDTCFAGSPLYKMFFGLPRFQKLRLLPKDVRPMDRALAFIVRGEIGAEYNFEIEDEKWPKEAIICVITEKIQTILNNDDLVKKAPIQTVICHLYRVFFNGFHARAVLQFVKKSLIGDPEYCPFTVDGKDPAYRQDESWMSMEKESRPTVHMNMNLWKRFGNENDLHNKFCKQDSVYDYAMYWVNLMRIIEPLPEGNVLVSNFLYIILVIRCGEGYGLEDILYPKYPRYLKDTDQEPKPFFAKSELAELLKLNKYHYRTKRP